MNLLQKLNSIKSKVAYIKKDKAVETYKAVTHDAVTAETRQWFVELGVLILTSELSSTMQQVGQTAKGNPVWRFEAKYRVTFMNCDEPTESISVDLTAHAQDHGDKAPGKAVSYATKYAILKVLQLETGEADEARTPQNMAPGDEIPEADLTLMLDAIHKADTVETLHQAYVAAYTRAAKDKDAQAAIIQAKDARKATLKVTK